MTRQKTGGAGRLNSNGLTDREQAFCDVYLADANKNAAGAYRQAYPSCTSDKAAASNSYKILNRPRVKAYLDAQAAKAAEEAGVKTAQVITEIARIAFFNPLVLFDDNGDLKPISEWPPEAGAAVKAVEINTTKIGDSDKAEVVTKRVAFWDKPKALEMLGKHLRLFDRASESDPSELLKELRQALTPTVGPPSLRQIGTDG